MSDTPKIETYNHAFDIAFAVQGSTDADGEDVTAAMLRAAVISRLKEMTDDELVEAVGAPFDSYLED